MDPLPRIDRKKPHVVFIPYPAQSHTKCMLKLARLLHHKGLHITFVNTESAQKRLLKYGGFHDLATAPGFQFKTVPDSHPSDDDTEPNKTASRQLFLHLLTNFLDSFLDLVAGLESPPTCIISDGFMTFTNTISAAERLKIPIILYWTLAACGFMAYYQTKVLTDKGLLPLKDESYLDNGYTDTLMDWIPGMEGTRLRDLPKHMLATKPDDLAYNYLLESARKAHKVSHMIIHTFDELEATLVKELRSIFPQIYTVGPQQLLLNQFIKTKSSSSNGYSLWKEEPECIEWLESKEPNSVVYVNFGSLAVMSLQDLLELGWGLINSNNYFLWIIRTDLVDGGPTVVLPPEFQVAVKTRGFIANWCSQEEVLNHPSIGGFFTHGGWGSVIESLSSGVPMICWPVSHDQGVNCRQMFQNWEVGMEIEGNLNRDGVEKLVKALMEGVEGKRTRKKAMEWKKMAEIATNCNGSSYLNIEELTNEITNFSRN